MYTIKFLLQGGEPQKAEGISGILSMRLRKSKPVNDHVQKHQNNQVDQVKTVKMHDYLFLWCSKSVAPTEK